MSINNFSCLHNPSGDEQDPESGVNSECGCIAGIQVQICWIRSSNLMQIRELIIKLGSWSTLLKSAY